MVYQVHGIRASNNNIYIYIYHFFNGEWFMSDDEALLLGN